MTAGLEAASAEEWLVATLAADATLAALVPGGIWNTQAPEGTAYPFVLIQMMSSNDYAAVGAYRIWANMIYLVKVVGDTADPGALDPAAARVDMLLHRGSGNATDGTVWSCTREQSIRLPDQVAGRPFRQAGGLYRIYAA